MRFAAGLFRLRLVFVVAFLAALLGCIPPTTIRVVLGRIHRERRLLRQGRWIDANSSSSSFSPSWSLSSTHSKRKRPVNVSESATSTASDEQTLSQSLSPSFPTLTGSLTPSFAVPDPACSGLDTVATIGIVSHESLSTPSSASDLITLSADVVSSTGYTLVVNVTSCHQFHQGRFRAIFDYNRTTSTSPVQAALESTAVSDPQFGFVSIMAQSRKFVRVDLATVRSALVTIGPDPKYGVYGRGEVVLLRLPKEAFIPRALIEVQLTILVAPLTTREETSVAGESGRIISIIAIALSNPSTAALIGRVNMLVNGLTCPNYLTDAPLPFDQNPSGIGFGTERKLFYHVGATLVNPAIALTVVCTHFLLVLIVQGFGYAMGNRLASLQAAMSLARFPSHSVAFGIFFLQGSVTSAVTVFLYSEFAFYSLVGAFVIFVVMSFPAAIYFRVSGARFLAVRASTEDPNQRTHPVFKHLVGTGEWIDRTRRSVGYVNRFGALFDEYLPARQWFFSLEIVFLVLFGVLDAVSPKTRIGCLLVSGGQTVALWFYLVMLVGTHPFWNTLSFVAYILIAVSQLFSSLSITVANLVEQEQRREAHMAASVLLLISVVFTILKTLHGLVLIGVSFWFSAERRRRVQHWKIDAKRRAKIARLHRQRAEDIQIAINALDDTVYFEQGDERNDGSCSDDSLNMENHDERGAQRIVGAVRSAEECPTATAEEENIYLKATGMKKREVWELL